MKKGTRAVIVVIVIVAHGVSLRSESPNGFILFQPFDCRLQAQRGRLDDRNRLNPVPNFLLSGAQRREETPTKYGPFISSI